MAILSRLKISPQERFDLEDFQSEQSAARSDSKLWTQKFLSENNLILGGFSVTGIGLNSATVAMTGCALIIPQGSFDFSYFVSAPAEPDVVISDASLVDGVRNYLEAQLTTQDGTPLTKAFWDPEANSGNGAEFNQIVNTITNLKISFVTSTGGFSGSVDRLPIAIIDTNGSGVIKIILDRRQLFGRLATPSNLDNEYTWGTKVEPVYSLNMTSESGTFVAGETLTIGSETATCITGGTTSITFNAPTGISFAIGSSVTGGTSGATGTVNTISESFSGVDKSLKGQKMINDALMTEFKKLKGTRFWWQSTPTLVGLKTELSSIIVPTTSSAKIKWDGSKLIITDDNPAPADADVVAAIRLLDSTKNLSLTRQDDGKETVTITLADIPDTGILTLNQNGHAIAINWNDSTSQIQTTWNGSGAFAATISGSPAAKKIVITANAAGAQVDVTQTTNTFTKSTVSVAATIAIKQGMASDGSIAVADGQFVFVTLPSPLADTTYDGIGSGALNYQVAARGALGITDQAYWIAYREGTKLVWRFSGEMSAGETSQVSDNIPQSLLDSLGLTSETAPPAYSSDIRGVANESLVSRLGVLTSASGDEQEDRSAYFRSDNEVTWSGTQLTFTSNIILEILNTKTGTLTQHIITTANSPISLANGDFAYVLIDRALASQNVTPILNSGTPIPAQTQANKNIFVICRRVDIGGVGHLYIPFHKRVMSPGQQTRFGSDTGVVDSFFAVKDQTDATKQIVFDAAGTTGTKTTLTGSQTANRVLTLPDATDTLVGKATTDALTNKSLDDTTTAITDTSDPTKKIAFDAGGSTGTKTTIAAAQTGNRTITLPDATDTLVGKATTDTLSNKILQLIQTTSANDATTGTAATLASLTTGAVRLTSGSLVSFSAIPAGTSAQLLLIENKTGNTIQVNNEDTGITAANRILTGSGTPIALANNSTLILIYDGTSSRWMVAGGSGSGSSSGGSKNYLTAYTASTASGTPNTGNGNFEVGSTAGWSTVHTTLSSTTPTTISNAGSALVTGQFIFVVTSANATVGATYTNNAQTFTVVNTIAAGTILVCTGTGAPTASGTLTKSTGSGDATITFASVTNTTASANLTLSTVTSGQLAQTTSGSLASSTASTAGDTLISNAFFIDSEDQAKSINFKFYYKTQSGAANLNFSGTSSNSYAVWIYDVTNAAWIQPAGVFNLVQNSGVGICTGSFQTTSNSTQYQIVLININASAGAFTLYVDDFFVGPQSTQIGAVITDSQSFTPSISTGTHANINSQWRQVGDHMEIEINHSTSSAGSGLWIYTIPASKSIDLTKMNVSNLTNGLGNQTLGSTIGNATFETGLNPEYGSGSVVVLSATTLGVLFTGAASSAFSTDGNNFLDRGVGLGSGLNGSGTSTTSFKCSVPIVGWSSNVNMSNDTDTRVVAFRAHSTTTQSINNTTDTTVTFGGTDLDTHGAWNSGTNTYTIPVSGIYEILGQVSFQANATNTREAVIVVNGTVVAGGEQEGTATANNSIPISYLNSFKAGDTVVIQGWQNTGGALNITNSNAAGNGSIATFFMIKRLSGPAVVAASESTNARYHNSATAISGSLATVVWTTKDFDSHNAMSNGVYTIPVSGKYQVNCAVITGGTFALNSNVDMQIQKNNVAFTEQSVFAFASATDISLTVGDIINCNAGDTIRVQISSTATLPTIASSDTKNWFSIAKVGN